MPEFTVTLDWKPVARLAADLSLAGPAVQLGAHQVVEDAAVQVEAFAVEYVPVLTGATRDSIGIDYPSPFDAEVGPTTPYAPFVEYGTSRMEPQPFMRPAADLVQPGFERAMLELAAASIPGFV